MTAVAPSSLFGNSTLSTVVTNQRADGQRHALILTLLNFLRENQNAKPLARSQRANAPRNAVDNRQASIFSRRVLNLVNRGPPHRAQNQNATEVSGRKKGLGFRVRGGV